MSASQSDRHGVQGAQRDREPVQDTRAAGTRLLSVARLRRIRRGRAPAERQELAGGRYDRRGNAFHIRIACRMWSVVGKEVL